MKLLQSIILTALLASAASAGAITCTTPFGLALNILPAPCEALLQNGPIDFDGVVDTNGDIHNIEITNLILAGLGKDGEGNSNHINVVLQGTDNDLSAQTVAGFGSSAGGQFSTNPGFTGYTAGGSVSVDITQLLIDLPSTTDVFEINLSQTSTANSSAPPNDGPTNTVTGTWSVYTSFSLTGAANSFVNADSAAVLDLTNQPASAPEPAAAAITLSGLTGLWFVRRRKTR